MNKAYIDRKQKEERRREGGVEKPSIVLFHYKVTPFGFNQLDMGNKINLY